jgi:hypothetical protein
MATKWNVVLQIRVLLASLIVTLAQTAPAFDTSYWVWQRTDALSPEEVAMLQVQGVRQIYWHIGELANTGERWEWKSRFRFPSNSTPVRVIPVVRLVSKEASPFNERSFESLRSNLVPIAKLTGALQIDYDSPDRLLNDYAGTLRKIHDFAHDLTITALPHWSRSNSWKAFQGSVDALFPMFYDFDPEPKLVGESPKSLIDSSIMTAMLQDWSRSPLPWYAGLPAFARLTVYDSTGKSRGQIRNWTWDEITFNQKLVGLPAASVSTMVLRATAATHVSNIALSPNDRLVARWTDLGLLEQASQMARESGAAGCVLFRLPNPPVASSGFSLRQLTHPGAKPSLHLRATGTNLTLENTGDGDLLPLLTSYEGKPRGYQLEIVADVPLFRETEPGDFPNAHGYENGESTKTVATPFAQRIAFGFSELRAGQSLQTGLIQLAPGVSFRQTRYRIQPLEKEWKLIELN